MLTTYAIKIREGSMISKNLKVRYYEVNSDMDKLLLDSAELTQFDALLINRGGLFYLYHPSIVSNELARCSINKDPWAYFYISSSDAEPIDSVIAKTLIGD
jgi:hypothetical protein